MGQADDTEQLWEIAERFGVKPGSGLLAKAAGPFDVTKPNHHDNKSDFLQEKQAVDHMIDHCWELLFLIAGDKDEPPETTKAREAINRFLDDSARSGNRHDLPETIPQFLRKAASDVSITLVLPYLLLDVWKALTKRKQELTDQEIEFWSDRHRPPNHYARTIALRLARMIAMQTRKRPTIGTARDGGHPSTEYGRALEDTFKVLGIKANVRNAGTWAIGQLTDDDISPPMNALAGLDWGSSQGQRQRRRNALDDIAKALQKG